jgi:hypothetical protein
MTVANGEKSYAPVTARATWPVHAVIASLKTRAGSGFRAK